MKEQDNLQEENACATKEESSQFVNSLLNFLQYSSVSLSGTVLQLILFYFLIQITNRIIQTQQFADGLTTAFCYFLSTLYTYAINKFFVFKTGDKGFSETLKYFAVAIPKILITAILVPLLFQALLPLLQDISAGWNMDEETKENSISGVKTFINAIVQFLLFFVVYFFSKKWVFKKEKE